jgi:predicted ATPase
MLKALELENFKAFGKRTRIEFAPITLLFGENSAGKSSVLQALNLLKQTRESREHGAVLLPRTENSIVDLGSYRELLFDHELHRQLRLRVEVDSSRAFSWPLRRSQRPSESAPIGMELVFARPSEEAEITLRGLSLLDSSFGGVVAVFESVDLPREELRTLMREAIIPPRSRRQYRGTRLRAARCTSVTENASMWSGYYALARGYADKIAKELRDYQNAIVGRPRQKMLLPDVEKDDQEWNAAVEQAIAFYSADFSYESFVARMRGRELDTLVALDGFVPVPTRAGYQERLPEFEVSRHIPGPSSTDDITLDVRRFAFVCGRSLDYMLEMIYPLGPYRKPPERWYVFTGTSPEDVGYRGDFLPDLLFRRPEVVLETNEWLDRLEIGYHIRPRPVGERARDLFEVRLVDRRRSPEIDVALSDVGFGISQILPFIVQSLASEKQIITIEQPEVHIHPRLQADLADLLIAGIQDPRSHRFVVETHSEHLILRLLRRIRETNEGELPRGHSGLRPEQLSVVYLERGLRGTEAHHLRVDATGEFMDRWPKGFFEERARELF